MSQKILKVLYMRPKSESLSENRPHNDGSVLFSSPYAAVMANTTQQPLLQTTSHGQTTMPVILPALPAPVGLSLTIVYIVMFSLLFILVYAQLWMIWYYRHKRLSHQTIFLFMCLIWAGLRTSLFSFYFYDCDIANDLPLTLYWLLYSLPVCLQFSMLCLLLHFFAQVRTFVMSL
ncbi:G protein-coupled receptor 137b [Plakobranchus ocellatus]|uniref:G protein-coupled receptor 137b n=1 Tax=Plakobranchus ocellatus TaxID=259542 RepID=A0AAV4C4L3_9GAST|nr:G protein-coupled receptor 137b [Plakobranchus ocellatus]